MHTEASNQRRAMRWFTPTALFLGTLLVIGATTKDYGVTWDEPAYFHATDLHLQWFKAVGDNISSGELRKSLDDATINTAWHWNPYNVPHPPFSRIVSGMAKELSSPFLDKFSAYRMGPALFFALLVVVMYLWINELYGHAAGLFSSLALVFIPNLFGYAHIAVTDLPLATMWFLTVYCFWKGLSHWQWSLLLGIVWGLALSTKFPAVLIPIPLILWAHLFHRDKYVNNVFAMLFLAPIIMVAIQPYLWHQTGLRVLEFLYEGISRGYRLDANFGVFFFNQILSSNQLPWYYPFFIVGVTTPDSLVALAMLGLLSVPWLQEQRSAPLLFFANAAFVLIMGILPGAVLHDGVRQLLSALPFLCALAGAGFYFLATWLLRIAQRSVRLERVANLKTKIIGTLFLLVCFNPALDLYLAHPFQLSYYNRLVGGIRGAYERGLEMTYFMEAFTPAFLNSLNEKLPANSVMNASFANFMFAYYQKHGHLRPDIKITETGPVNYYVLLNRRSVLTAPQRRLMSGSTQSVLSVNLAGVSLVRVFEFKQP